MLLRTPRVKSLPTSCGTVVVVTGVTAVFYSHLVWRHDHKARQGQVRVVVLHYDGRYYGHHI